MQEPTTDMAGKWRQLSFSMGNTLISTVVIFWIATATSIGSSEGFLFSSVKEPSPVVIQPHRLELEENAQLEMTCEVSDSVNQTHNASDLYFQKNRLYAVGDPYFQIVSSHKAKLHVPMATYESWRGFVMCGIHNVETAIHHLRDFSAMVIFRRDPLVPSLESCVVHNWEMLTCTWSPSLDEQLAHTHKKHHVRYKFVWKFVQEHHVHYCCSDPRLSDCPNEARNLTANSCTLRHDSIVNPFLMGEQYNLSVRAETDKAFEVAKWANGTALNTTLHVKPNPPDNLAVTEHNRTHSAVRWRRPATTWTPAYEWTLDYSLLVASEFNQDSYSISTSEEYITAYIPVHPYTSYYLKLSVIPTIGGQWSETVESSYTTPARAPDVNPEVFQGAYDYDHSCQSMCWVTLYWKPLKYFEVNGPSFQYIVKTRRVSELGGVRQNMSSRGWESQVAVSDVGTSSVKVRVEKHQAVEVWISARNEAGDCPLSGEVIRINHQNELLSLQEHLVVEGSETNNKVLLWLDRPDTVDSAATYTVFWKNKNSQVVDPVGWINLPPGGNSHVSRAAPGSSHDELYRFDFTPDNQYISIMLPSPHYHYRFGLSKSIGRKNSGIVWKDVYPDTIDVLPPSELKVIHTRMHSLTLSWNNPQANYITKKAYILQYKISFCVKDPETGVCQKPVRFMTQYVPSNETHVDLSDLDPDTQYIISVTSVSRTSESSHVYVQGPCQTQPGLSAMALAGIVISAVVGFVVCTIGIYTYCKKFRDLKNWFSKGITVKFPEETKHTTRESTSSEMPLFRNSSSSSYNMYRCQTSVISDVSSDGDQCSENTEEPCFEENIGGYSRVGYSPTSLKSIPENDDVFEEDSDKSDDNNFVKTYRLLPSDQQERVPLSKEENWSREGSPDDTLGGISKYAVLSSHQDGVDTMEESPRSSSSEHVEDQDRASQGQDDTVRDANPALLLYPSVHDNYVPNNCKFDQNFTVPAHCIIAGFSLVPEESLTGSAAAILQSPSCHRHILPEAGNDSTNSASRCAESICGPPLQSSGSREDMANRYSDPVGQGVSGGHSEHCLMGNGQTKALRDSGKDCMQTPVAFPPTASGTPIHPSIESTSYMNVTAQHPAIQSRISVV